MLTNKSKIDLNKKENYLKPRFSTLGKKKGG